MSEKIILYHKEKAPNGNIVMRSDVENLMDNGWVTSPADFNKQEDVPVDNIHEIAPDKTHNNDYVPMKKGKRSRR